MKLIPMMIASALSLAATAAMAQDFGGQEDQDYAGQLWEYMQDRNLAGDDAVQAFPYPGSDPHGMMLETFYTDATVDDHTGTLVIKRNYGPEGVTVDQVLGQPGDHLAAITIMFRREQGYAPDSGNWFWAKYLADGSLDQTPDGTPIAGTAQGCIGCHASAEGDDFVFTTNASFDTAPEAGASGDAQEEASSDESTRDVAAGEAIYEDSCRNCHGPEARGMASFPQLAGSDESYLISRLEQYRAGEKVGSNSALMIPMARDLSDQDIANVAAFIATTFD